MELQPQKRALAILGECGEVHVIKESIPFLRRSALVTKPNDVEFATNMIAGLLNCLTDLIFESANSANVKPGRTIVQ